VPGKISMGSNKWRRVCLVVTSSAHPESHDQNGQRPRPTQTRFFALVRHGLSANTSPISRAHGTCLLMYIQEGVSYQSHIAVRVRQLRRSCHPIIIFLDSRNPIMSSCITAPAPATCSAISNQCIPWPPHRSHVVLGCEI